MDEKRVAGYEPRKMSGSYEYKDGDWTYEELLQHRAELLRDQRVVWAALGFDKPWLVTAEEVAAKARLLRGPFGWVHRLFGKKQPNG
jgi:hypothetical protein